MACRKDGKGRVLRKGENYRKTDGRYSYVYHDALGKKRTIYAKSLTTLRQKEETLVKDQMDGINFYIAGKADVNFLFDRYISTKSELRSTTYTNYTYMWNHFIRDTLGKRKIKDVKYSEILYFYNDLVTNQGMAINTLETINTILRPTFQLAVRDDIIRKNPVDGAYCEIKKRKGGNRKTRRALTVEQQRAFMDYVAKNPFFYHWYPLFAFLLGTGCRIGDDDDKIRLNQRKPSKYKGLRRFGPEKNLQRINKFMKERPIFYKNLIQMKENIRFYLRCFYCITKVMILQFNSENRTELARNG